MQPAEGWVRHEIEAASLQERGDGETQRDVRSEFADCPFDDRQELGEMRPAGMRERSREGYRQNRNESPEWHRAAYR